MKYLAIDTSGKNLTVILSDGKTEISIFDENCATRHSVELMPRVEELVKKSKINLEEIDFFAVVIGAGSFTGIRIGVATVKAMCFAYKKPCLSITSFDTIAYNKKGEKVLALIDAKHNGFYACGYDQTGKVIFPPSFIMREEVLSLIKEYKPLSFEKIEGIDNEVVNICEGLKLAIEQKQKEIDYDLSKIEPLYVRKSQAEEGR